MKGLSLKLYFFGRRLSDRPEDREGSVQRGVPRQGSPQWHGRRPQEGPDIRDDGQQGQARLHEGDTAVAGRARECPFNKYRYPVGNIRVGEENKWRSRH